MTIIHNSKYSYNPDHCTYFTQCFVPLYHQWQIFYLFFFQPNGKLYESFSVFCPCDQLEHLDLLADEDVLIDWSQPIYLNFTHAKIMNKIEEFYADRGTVDKLYGDIYGLTEPLEEKEEGNTEMYVLS